MAGIKGLISVTRCKFKAYIYNLYNSEIPLLNRCLIIFLSESSNTSYVTDKFCTAAAAMNFLQNYPHYDTAMSN
jgi:hypothetical protein